MFTNLLGTIILPAAIIAVIVLYMAKGRSVEYQCESCGEIFTLSPLSFIAAPHMMGKKFVKCPECGVTDWVSPVRGDH